MIPTVTDAFIGKMLVGLIASSLALLQPPVAPSTAHALVSRRAVIAAPLLAVALPAFAEEDDKLVAKLIESREKLVLAASSFDAEDWDGVRTAVKFTLQFMTLKGYLRDSVKARIMALGDEKNAELKGLRYDLLVLLSGVDNYCYGRQSGNMKNVPTAAEAKAQLDGSVAALDKVITSTRAAGTALAAAQ